MNNKDVKSCSNKKNKIYPMLRELRRELLLEISGGDERVGSSDEITAWILKKYQENSIIGDIFRAILLLNEDLLITEDELPSLSECKKSIDEIEKLPLPKFGFITSALEGETLGVLIQTEQLEVGGLVYSLTIFNQKNLTKGVQRIEIRAYNKEPEPFVSIFTAEGWVTIPKDKIHLEKNSTFALRCLVSLHHYKYPKISPKFIIDNKVIKPKPNKYLEKLITRAYLNKVACHKVKVSLSQITPRDLDYALKVHEEQVKSCMDQITSFGHSAIELLLYEKAGCLIMDDDYTPYLAYRALDFEEVPAVILGSFDHSNINITILLTRQ